VSRRPWDSSRRLKTSQFRLTVGADSVALNVEAQLALSVRITELAFRLTGQRLELLFDHPTAPVTATLPLHELDPAAVDRVLDCIEAAGGRRLGGANGALVGDGRVIATVAPGPPPVAPDGALPAVEEEPAEPAEVVPPPEPEPEPEPEPAPPALDLTVPDDSPSWLVFEPLPTTLRLLADE
jgi:hypothetical protein